MHKRIILAVLGTLGALIIASPSFAQSYSYSGKKSAYSLIPYGAANGGGPMPSADVSLTSTSIARGLRKYVLVVHGELTGRGNGNASAVRINAAVNGHNMEGETAYGNCGGSEGCSATGTWFLDLDEAEASFPGTFIGQTLTVELVGGDAANPGRTGTVNLIVELVKK
jgi:hypothetical protein